MIYILFLLVVCKGYYLHHRDVFYTLVILKNEWRDTLVNFEEIDKRDLREFTNKSSLITSQLAPIPDSCFNTLKSCHYKKVELSKMISKNPGSTIFILKLKILWDKNLETLFKKGGDK